MPQGPPRSIASRGLHWKREKNVHTPLVAYAGQGWPPLCSQKTKGMPSLQPLNSTQGEGSVGLGLVGLHVLRSIQKALALATSARVPVSCVPWDIQTPGLPMQLSKSRQPPEDGATARNTWPRWQPSVCEK